MHDAPLAARVSRLAVTGLILAVIPLCFPLNLIGVALGISAVIRIRQSHGAMRGLAAARAAIVVGSIMTVAGWWLTSEIANWSERATLDAATTAVDGFITAARDGQATEAAAWWSAQVAVPGADEIEAFGAAVRQAGALGEIGVRSIEPTSSGGITSPVLSAWLIIHIEATPRDGTAVFELMPGTSPLEFKAALREISITLDGVTHGLGAAKAQAQ